MSNQRSFLPELVGTFITTYLFTFSILGVLWYFKIHVPYVGTLPGDMEPVYSNRMVYLPFTSSATVAVPLSFLVALIRTWKKDKY